MAEIFQKSKSGHGNAEYRFKNSVLSRAVLRKIKGGDLKRKWQRKNTINLKSEWKQSKSSSMGTQQQLPVRGSATQWVDSAALSRHMDGTAVNHDDT
jgi:hypothetical protein